MTELRSSVVKEEHTLTCTHSYRGVHIHPSTYRLELRSDSSTYTFMDLLEAGGFQELAKTMGFLAPMAPASKMLPKMNAEP